MIQENGFASDDCCYFIHNVFFRNFSSKFAFESFFQNSRNYKSSFHLDLRTCYLQMVQVDLVTKSYELNPDFGNVSAFETNQTHTGAVTFWVSRNVSSFTVRKHVC